MILISIPNALLPSLPISLRASGRVGEGMIVGRIVSLFSTGLGWTRECHWQGRGWPMKTAILRFRFTLKSFICYDLYFGFGIVRRTLGGLNALTEGLWAVMGGWNSRFTRPLTGGPTSPPLSVLRPLCFPLSLLCLNLFVLQCLYFLVSVIPSLPLSLCVPLSRHSLPSLSLSTCVLCLVFFVPGSLDIADIVSLCPLSASRHRLNLLGLRCPIVVYYSLCPFVPSLWCFSTIRSTALGI